MKHLKNLLFVILLFVSATQLNAQNVEFAASLGTIGSQVTSEDFDFQRRVGLQTGVTVDFFFRENFSIRSGQMFKQRNIGEVGIIDGELVEGDGLQLISIGLQIPVVAHYHFNKYLGAYLGPSLEHVNGIIDYGVNAGVTIKIKKFEVTLDYNKNFNDVTIFPVEHGKYNSFSMCTSFYFKQ